MVMVFILISVLGMLSFVMIVVVIRGGVFFLVSVDVIVL